MYVGLFIGIRFRSRRVKLRESLSMQEW